MSKLTPLVRSRPSLHRQIEKVVAVAAVMAVLAAMAAAPSSATSHLTCSVSGATVTLTITGPGSVTVSRTGLGAIQVNGADCSGASVSNVGVVNINDTSSEGHALTLDMTNGFFAHPQTGAMIDFNVSMGQGIDRLTAKLRPVNDQAAMSFSVASGDESVPTIDFNTGNTFEADMTANGRIEQVVLDGQAGDDKLLASAAVEYPMTLIGGDGADELRGGDEGDILRGGPGPDKLDGGDNASPGVDSAEYTASAAGVNVFLPMTGTATARGGDAEGDTLAADDIENITGSAHGDVLTGDGGANGLNGGSGDDVLKGLGGSGDLIFGMGGNDRASYAGSPAGVTVSLSDNTASGGHAFDDTLLSIEGVIGSSHNDLLSGNGLDNSFSTLGVDPGGQDTVSGGDGSDTIDYDTGSATPAAVIVNLSDSSAESGGEAANDLLFSIENVVGTPRNDVLIGNALENVLLGRAGDDRIAGLAAGVGLGDTLRGEDGIDTLDLSASSAAVNVTLGATQTSSGGHAEGDVLSGFENVFGSSHADTIATGVGPNLVRGGPGADELSGGAGVDFLDYSTSGAGVTIALNTSPPSASGGDAQGDHKLTGFESIIGSAHADNLTGSSGKNLIRGGPGGDVVDGAGGVDTLDYSTSLQAVSVSLDTGATSEGDAAGDQIAGDSFENLVGSRQGDILIGDERANLIAGGAGGDDLTGGGGTDTLDYSTSIGSVSINLSINEAKFFDADGDTIEGFVHVNGGQGHDTLTGDASANVLRGNGGGDTLQGLAGADILAGGGDPFDRASYLLSPVAVQVNLGAKTATGGDAAGDKLSGIVNLLGSQHNDTLTGSALKNDLDGAQGNDTIDVKDGIGGDTANGGSGENGTNTCIRDHPDTVEPNDNVMNCGTIQN